MAVEELHSNGADDESNAYPRSWPKPVPLGSEIPCTFLRQTLRVAEAIAVRRFARKPDRDELVCDAVSVAWEMAMLASYRRNGQPGSIAAFAVKRVARRLQFTRSERDLVHPFPRSRPRAQRRRFDLALTLASRGSTPSDAAEFEIDMATWLASLTARRRQVALLLASGHSTAEIAERSGCTLNAVRMIRMALRRSYQAYFNDCCN